jgi:hypothetical protein
MGDPRALLGPLFSTTCRTSLSAYHGTVNAPQLFIYGDLSLQVLKDLVQGPITVPLVKQTPDGLPLSKLFSPNFWVPNVGAISPRSPGTKNPENPIEDIATVKGRPTARFANRDHWSDALPLCIAHA